jgi:hypothetical protein
MHEVKSDLCSGQKNEQSSALRQLCGESEEN